MDAMEAKLSADVDVARTEMSHRVLLLRNYLESRAGVKPGDIVRRSDGHYPGMIFKVVEVRVWESGGTAWVKGVTKRKDGTWGTGVKNMYSHWEKVDAS